MKNLVIGNGEIGKGIAKALDCPAVDIGEVYEGKGGAIHICFGYSDDFVDNVKTYKMLYNPDLTIIHSTVPVGTSDECGAVHSPVRGVHPDLYGGIMTFVKFFGGNRAGEAAKIFEERGIETFVTGKAVNTELGKLHSTTQHGAAIMLNKEIYQNCEDEGADFDIVYRLFNKTYNDGYKRLGKDKFTRPLLDYMPGGIGGHCVVPNCELLGTETAQQIILKNQQICDSQ